MYKEHYVFNPPSDNATLWRYLSFTKFVSLLGKKALFFSRADKLGDPFEGTLTKINCTLLEQNHEIPDEMKTAHLDFIRNCSRFILVSCWHESAHESAAMWKLYSKEQEGIAIKTNFESFRQSFTDEEDIFIGKIDYIDYQNYIIPVSNFFYPYLHKRKSFEHENEVRAIMMCFPPPTENMDLSRDTVRAGRYCKVNISSLVQEVVVAPYAEDWFLELVVSISNNYGLSAPVYRSSLADKPDWM